jgi:hypothetical protein
VGSILRRSPSVPPIRLWLRCGGSKISVIKHQSNLKRGPAGECRRLAVARRGAGRDADAPPNPLSKISRKAQPRCPNGLSKNGAEGAVHSKSYSARLFESQFQRRVSRGQQTTAVSGERIRLSESRRANSGVSPGNPVRRDAERHTRDAYAPPKYPRSVLHHKVPR